MPITNEIEDINLGELPEYDTPIEESKPRADRAASDAAFYNTSLSESVNVLDDFTETRDNILNNGYDESVQQTKQELAEVNNTIVKEQAVEMLSDSNIPLQDKKDALLVAQERLDSPVELSREYMYKEAAGYNPSDPNNKEVHENLIEGVDDIYEADKISRKEVLDYISKVSENKRGELGADADFFGAVMPFNVSQTYRNIIEKTFGKSEASLAFLSAPGEGLRYIKDRLWSETDSEERKTLVRELIKNIDESAGTFDDNDFIRWQISHEVFKPILDPSYNPEDTDWDRIIENVAGGLDTLMVGGFLRGVYTQGKALSILKNSPVEVTSHVNPSKTKELVSSAIADKSGKIAEALGTTKETLIESTLYPKPLDRISHQKMPADIAESVEDVQRTAESIIKRTESFGFAFSKEEKAAAAIKVEKTLEGTTGAKYYQSMSEISTDSEGISLRSRFGYDENHGFKNGLEASRKGQELFPESEIKVLKRNKNGEIVPTHELSSKGEYFFEINERRAFDARDALYFEPNSVNHARTLGFGPTSPAAKFHSDISDIGAMLPGIEKKVQTDLLSVLKGFTGLNTNSKNKVSDVLLKGYKDSKTFDYDELVSLGLKNDEIKGYYNLRGINDLQYIIENRRVYKDLKQQGMLHVSNQKNGYNTIAKPVSESEAITNAKTAYDPSTSSIRTLSPEEIKSLYKNGDSLGFMYGTERSGNQIANYVVIDSKLGGRTSPLPAKVLNYDPGYITRVYKNRYFIDEVSTREINGVLKPYTRTINAASTEREALGHINKLRESGEEGIEYIARLDRGLTQAELGSREKSMRLNKGALFTGTRGKRLSTDFGLAEIDEPVEALLRTIGTVSRHASHTDVIASMKKRWMNSYGHLFSNAYPSTKNEFTAAKGANLETVTDVKDAKSYWDYINLLEDVDPSGKIVDIRANMIKLGEWALGNGDSSTRAFIGNKIIDASAIDPLGRVRSLAFNMYLAGNPLRQFFLQSAQYMFLAGIDPKFSGFIFSKNGIARQKIGLDLAMASFTNKELYKKVAPSIAKSAGISEKELTTLVKSFRESGLPFSIDSHTFVRDSLQDYSKVMHRNNATAFVNKAFTLPKKVLGVSRKVGFDAGEYNNLSNSWLFARNRWIQKNPNKDWTLKGNQDQIAAEARQYSLNMTKSGSFSYQRGLLSIPTQFISIQHKALEAMLPVKAGGSRFFTAAEKRRIAVGQAALYGTAGFGVTELYKEVRDRMSIEVDEDVDQIVTGGLSEFVTNKILQTIYEDDTSVKLAKDFAPASGILETNIQKSLVDLMTGGKSPLEYMPAGTAANRIMKAMSYGKYVYEAPNIDTTEKLQEILASGVSVFSGYNNYLKASAALNLGHMVDATGDPIVKATYAEAMAKLFGLQSGEESDYYDVLQAQFSDVSGPRKEKKLKEVAKTYYDNISKRVGFFSEQSESLNELNHKRLVEAIQAEATILSVMNPLDAQYVLTEFRKILTRNLENGSDRLISSITKNALGNQYGDSWEFIVNRLKNSSLINSPEKEKDIKELYDFMTEEQKIAEQE